VRVPTSALADVPVGATVKATIGSRITDSASVDDGLAPAKSVLAASVVAGQPAPAVPQTSPTVPAGTTDRITVAMVAPAGSTQDSTTLADVVAAVNGPTASFWNTQSGGAVQLAVDDTHDWATATHDCSNPEALWDEVAHTVGFTRGAGKHLLLYVPKADTQCAYGLAEIGPSLHFGGYAYVQDTTTSVIAHELGHNFGLLHSASEECPGAVEAAPSTCDIEEYGDLYDVMGASWTQVGSLSAAQSANVALLPPTRVVVDQVAGHFEPDVELAPYGGSGALYARALEIVDPLTSNAYFLEYRTATGQDAYLADASADLPGLRAGLQLRRVESTSDAYSSVLLDGSPTAGAGWNGDTDPTFPPGATVHIPGAHVGIQLVSADATGATVHLTQETPIDLAHAAAGGDAGWQGAATAGQSCGGDGGCSQPFQHTTLYWTPQTGAHAVSGGIGATWDGLGAAQGVLGYPVAEMVCGLRDGGCGQAFASGAVYWSAASGTHAVSGGIRAAWGVLGLENGVLGYPAADMVCGLRSGGCGQAFQAGAVYWSAGSGVHTVSGAIRAAWSSLGSENGALGYPVGEMVCVPTGCHQSFQRGTLTWSAATNTVARG
jgi:hypothetical protein